MYEPWLRILKKVSLGILFSSYSSRDSLRSPLLVLSKPPQLNILPSLISHWSKSPTRQLSYEHTFSLPKTLSSGNKASMCKFSHPFIVNCSLLLLCVR